MFGSILMNRFFSSSGNRAVLSSRTQRTHELFQLSCTFTGSPGTAYWFKDADTFINPDGMFRIETILTNDSSVPVYITTLTGKSAYSNVQLEAIYSCNFLSQIVHDGSSNRTNFFSELHKVKNF